MKKIITMLATLALMAAFVVPVFSADAQYVGVNKCKMCHKSAKKGNQFGKWSESAHAKAYATLATDEAKAVAKKAGVSGDPQKAAECLTCHVTGYSAPASAKAATYKMEEGVTCEQKKHAWNAITKKVRRTSRSSLRSGGKKSSIRCRKNNRLTLAVTLL